MVMLQKPLKLSHICAEMRRGKGEKRLVVSLVLRFKDYYFSGYYVR
jgi:hypothetical protein